MCGICGEIRFDGTPARLGSIQVMNDQMQPRGPDDSGTYASGGRAFGHRRLKIMDLSDASQQPMLDSELGLGIVFNGAIYNHHALREELRELGYKFFSDGDTEVILKAYHAWGSECLQRFKGMFAFAIWERDSGRTFLARDRLGIKPLYFSASADRYRFASTLPALLKAGDLEVSVDPVALNHYLSFHSVVPAPRTILSGVRKVRPGHFMVVEANGEIREEGYWSLSFQTDHSLDSAQWQEQLLEQLRAAVKRRLVAAVDVGVLLSGGIDSSLLVGLIAEAGVSRFQTFSVGFESVGDEAGDEFEYSDLVAEAFSTDHNKIRVCSDELLAELPSAIAAMSEPMVSHDCIGFYLLSREVARSCRAVQSGQGADEVFGGYHWYPPLVGSNAPFETYRSAFFDRDYAEYERTVAPSLVGGDHASDFVRCRFGADGVADPVDKALHLDTTVIKLLDQTKIYLHAVIDNFSRKILVLKETARSVIPDKVIDRPKGYFPVPALKYLRGNVLEMVQDTLSGSAATARGLFDRKYVDTLLDDPEAHITPLRGSKLWQLGLLENWLQTHGI